MILRVNAYVIGKTSNGMKHYSELYCLYKILIRLG